MKKIYYLSSCDTCKRIIKTLQISENFILQDIKNERITEEQLEEMQALSGNYESLFSKRARLFKELGLKEKTLTETDYKNFILQHYTFLKRPVILYGKKIFIGNAKKTIEAAKQAIHE